MRRLNPTEPLIMLATIAQWLVLALSTGAIVGVGCSIFLRALFASEGRLYDVPFWVLAVALPLGGLANGLLLYYTYRYNKTGLLDEPIAAVNEQRGHMPLRVVWVKPLAALITLGCGGSAGKEGPCSHIGASVGALLGEFLHLTGDMRQRLVACGVSAGFASVFGTPIAGAIYGVEMLAIGRIRQDLLFPGVIAGITAFEVSKALGVPYPDYVSPFGHGFTELLFLKTIVIGVLCGVIASWLVEAIRFVREGFAWLQRRYQIWQPLLPTAGGVLMVLVLTVAPTEYIALSLPVMEQALAGDPMPYFGFLWKIVLVALTLGSGFYAGIVTPQFVIGAVVGGAVAPLLGMHPAQGAAVGLVAVVASASNTPVAAILMGIELFGGEALLYVAGPCIAAYLMIGHRSVYPAQHLAYSKSEWLVTLPDRPVGTEKVQLSYGLLRWWGQRIYALHHWQRMRRAQRKQTPQPPSGTSPAGDTPPPTAAPAAAAQSGAPQAPAPNAPPPHD